MPPRRELTPEPTAMEMVCQCNKLKPPKFWRWNWSYGIWGVASENGKLIRNHEMPQRFKMRLEIQGWDVNVETD